MACMRALSGLVRLLVRRSDWLIFVSCDMLVFCVFYRGGKCCLEGKGEDKEEEEKDKEKEEEKVRE